MGERGQVQVLDRVAQLRALVPVAGPLLALTGVRALAIALINAGVARALLATRGLDDATSIEAIVSTLAWMLLGVAGGCLLAFLQKHPRRRLGLIPLGLTGLALTLGGSGLAGDAVPPLAVTAGLFAGLAHSALQSEFQARARATAGLPSSAALTLGSFVVAGGLAAVVLPTMLDDFRRWSVAVWLLAALTATGAAAAWRIFFREAIEQITEIVLVPIYRIHGHGPGLHACPPDGPLLVVANHTTWFDPLWLGKVLPRRLTPMMTSVFFDLRGLRWLMKHVVHAIRVPSLSFRREAPELQKAVSALDKGQLVLIFPEGMLRRSEERPVRMFGQGVWHILRERPHTPVMVCWIEGGWGSFTSYHNGPPATNKRFDWWRRIDIALGEPFIIDPAILEDQRGTRLYLRDLCLQARAHLGLEPLSVDNADEEAMAGRES
jgi:1-acyl-sn-glycerol-3-phosphate acyltransferase